MLGKLVLKTSYETNTIDVQNLAKGVYLLHVYSGNKKGVKKMIID
jgi:hypothetical protein